ncbi:hypothetical protein GCM10027610_127040 [Dactylosporangium cerinum]
MTVRWRAAMERALYGDDGFFVRPDAGPAAHFRTSAHASPLFAAAIATLLERVDEALDRPARLDLVDVGAGRGELLRGILAALPPAVAARVAPVGVEVAPAPTTCPTRSRGPPRSPPASPACWWPPSGSTTSRSTSWSSIRICVRGTS